ncbi:2-amino-3-ketobutyrate coenzyme A ligase [Klebsormidium nitens]|uniref:2-amino-3-ketobutyrate coenzyme A ligase, mitochondrial n=1 Tax=Klebsormidium nitens TaxID=105231 RepID=A0A1Y1I813_KLENI|nr:2-amino-3-ketobutyrate coenzyme A ligase [Klebsormidium nitens]|eukprot:GAQ87080.1 2-amino-3-ketobutyrate coenzyme A ligase [Klebsormidium nitens]
MQAAIRASRPVNLWGLQLAFRVPWVRQLSSSEGFVQPGAEPDQSDAGTHTQATEKQDALHKALQQQLEEMKKGGTFKSERVITTPQSASIHVAGGSFAVLNFCANNYLGLSNHPTLVAAAKKALDTHGFGLSSVRFICGTQDLHKELEAKLSEFHGTDDTILYPSCFDANGGLFEAILTSEDAVISDELNHASIIDGIRLCKAQRRRYKHVDMADLETHLRETQNARVRLIATDGVFSMDGHVAPLDEIVGLAQKHDAVTFVDDCHATGFLGATGRGTDEYCGVQGKVDIINSTLGKALGGATGGYTTGRKDVVDILRQKARPYLFSNTLAPSVAAASIAAMDLLISSTELRDKLADNTAYFRKKMAAAGFKLQKGDHPIVPIMLGDARLAHDMAEKLLEKGIYVIGFSYPVVPKGAARIRVQLSAGHSREQLDRAIAAFQAVGKSLGVID